VRFPSVDLSRHMFPTMSVEIAGDCTLISDSSQLTSLVFSSGILGSLRRPHEEAMAGISSSFIRKMKLA